MSKRKRKHIDPAPKFIAGDVIRHPKYGVGRIEKIEPDFEFFYFTNFRKKMGGDGTKVWLPKLKTEKVALLLTRNDEPYDNTPACEATSPSCPATCFGPDICPACK